LKLYLLIVSLIFIWGFFVKRDVEQLKNLFDSLNIKTIVHQDLTYHQILRQAVKFSYDEEFIDTTMSVFVLMAHGSNDGELFTADGSLVKTEDIIGVFDETPDLIGKPKWFIFLVRPMKLRFTQQG